MRLMLLVVVALFCAMPASEARAFTCKFKVTFENHNTWHAKQRMGIDFGRSKVALEHGPWVKFIPKRKITLRVRRDGKLSRTVRLKRFAFPCKAKRKFMLRVLSPKGNSAYLHPGAGTHDRRRHEPHWVLAETNTLPYANGMYHLRVRFRRPRARDVLDPGRVTLR